MKSIRIGYLFLLVTLIHGMPSYAGTVEKPLRSVSSRISAVTVYSDRARVTRAAQEKLPAGEQRLLFDNLPMGLLPESVQVEGTGDAELKDVKTIIERYAETPDKDLKVLLEEKSLLEDQLTEKGNTISLAQSEKTFLENITRKLTGVTDKTPAGELDPEKWVKMVDFYRIRNTSLDKEIREVEIARRDLKGRLDKVNQQIADLGSMEQKTKYQVAVTVRMMEPGDLTLRLSYMVYGPSWQPLYDLRVSTRDKKMNLAYNAVIRQNTTEVWENVALELSTAQPQIGGAQPELSPWHLGFPETYPRRGRNAEPILGAAMAQMYETRAKALDKREDGAAAPTPALEKPEATLQSNATSVIFQVAGTNSIASDNLPHKVTIMIRDFPSQFRYSTVPKLSPYVYLKTRVKNTTNFPLLPGESNVFLDGNFVANASLGQVAPGEEFWTFLGIDGGIKTERKFLRKYQKQEGVFEKKTKMVYEYRTELSNNKKSEEELVLWDQIPTSTHQDITVTLLEPELEKNSEKVKKNEQDYLEWLFKLKPGEKVIIPFSYSVEYPRDRQVSGLE